MGWSRMTSDPRHNLEGSSCMSESTKLVRGFSGGRDTTTFSSKFITFGTLPTACTSVWLTILREPVRLYESVIVTAGESFAMPACCTLGGLYKFDGNSDEEEGPCCLRLRSNTRKPKTMRTTRMITNSGTTTPAATAPLDTSPRSAGEGVRNLHRS